MLLNSTLIKYLGIVFFLFSTRLDVTQGAVIGDNGIESSGEMDPSSTCIEERCGESYNSTFICHCDIKCEQYNNCCPNYIDICSNKSVESCLTRCGEDYDANKTCHCDAKCNKYRNCCDDFNQVCTRPSTCFRKCGARYDRSLPCQCNEQCSFYGNCCQDYEELCYVEKYLCKGECNVTRERCSCQPGCVENRTCCSDYQESCFNQTSWLEDECSSRSEMECSSDFEVPPFILFSIDGFSHEYLKLNLTPNIIKLGKCGVSAPLRPIYPTKTFPTHYTIATGLYPESHGIIGNTMYDHDLDAEFRLGRKESFNPAWWGGEPIWVTSSNQGKASATYFWPGSDVNITRYPDYYYKYDGSVDDEERVYQVLDWLDLPKKERPSFITLYMSFVDRAGHSGGPESADVNRALILVDKYVGILMDGLKLRSLENCVNLLIVADHGMSPISCDRKSSLETYGVNTDTVYLKGGSLGRIGKSKNPTLWDQFNATEVNDNLRCLRNETHWNSYLKYQYFPKRFHYANNRRIEPVQLVMDDEWLVEGRLGSYTRCNGGNHGYDNSYKKMMALFVSHGPGFKRNYSTPYPIESIELYNVMTGLLEINPGPNNGTRGSLNHLLENPQEILLPLFPAIPECPYSDSDPVTNNNCPACEKISEDDLKSRLQLRDEEIIQSLKQNTPYATSSNEQSVCTLTHRGYVNVYNTARNISHFVSYFINPNSTKSAASDCWLSDPRLQYSPAACDQYNADQTLNPVQLYLSDFSSSNTTFEALIMSNRVPMYNQAQTVWSRTTMVLSDWSKKFDGIHVSSGPIYDYNFDGLADSDATLQERGRYLMDGANQSIPIPTHYFVIALRCTSNGADIGTCHPSNLDSMSFILPNFELGPCNERNETNKEWIFGIIENHLARIRDIELLTGIVFFPNLYETDKSETLRLKLRLPLIPSAWFEIIQAAPLEGNHGSSTSKNPTRVTTLVLASIFLVFIKHFLFN